METCELDQLVGKVAANMILPYPPGVPLVMPGEMITEEPGGARFPADAVLYR